IRSISLTMFLLVLFGVGTARIALRAGEPLDSENSGSRTPSFEVHIRPILHAKCWKCHGEKTRKAELALHTVDGIRKGSESGPVIVPGKSAESPLFEMIHKGKMPPPREKNALTVAEVEAIRRWIDGGARFGGVASARPEVTQHDILPILHLRCTACHGKEKRESGLDLRSRAAMLKGGKSGPAFVSGQPEKSLILKRV